MAPLPTPRGALAAAVGRAGTIFAIGGFDGASVLNSVETFRPRHEDAAQDQLTDNEDGDNTAIAPRCGDSQSKAH